MFTVRAIKSLRWYRPRGDETEAPCARAIAGLEQCDRSDVRQDHRTPLDHCGGLPYFWYCSLVLCQE